MKLIASNRKAHFNYQILDSIEAGIVLSGDEIKSLRAGKISIDESFATIHDGEILLLNCYIAPYTHAYSKTDTSRRSRKLLLHKREIDRLIGDIARKGITLIPLKIYFNQRGYVKVEIGIAKHKKLHEKKRDIKERDIKRETLRESKIKL